MTVRVEAAGAALVVTLARPEKKNAIDEATALAIAAAVREASATPSVRGVVITAEGDTFSAGGDIDELTRLPSDARGAAAVLASFEALTVIETCDVPVVAAVQGDAFGGGAELLLLCDLAIVEAHARLAFRHARMGLTPPWGGLVRLGERVGSARASRLLLTAEPASAEEAASMGLVNEAVPKGEGLTRALALVTEVAKNQRAAVAAMKRALFATRQASRGDALAVHRSAFEARWGSPEHASAMRAFAQKKR